MKNARVITGASALVVWAVASATNASVITLSITASSGVYKVFASDTLNDNAGIMAFDVDVIASGGITFGPAQAQSNRAPLHLDFDGSGTPAGFTNRHNGTAISGGYQFTAIQPAIYNSPVNDPTQDALVFQGIGQVAGDDTAAAQNAGGIGGVTWASPVLLVQGTYTENSFGSLTARLHTGDIFLTLNGTGAGTWTGPANTSSAPTVLSSTATLSQAIPIISLTSAAPSGFGVRLNEATASYSPDTNTDPKLNPAGTTTTGYTPGFAHIVATSGTALANVKEAGIAAADRHLYLLKLMVGGNGLAVGPNFTQTQYNTDINQLVSDINASTGHTGSPVVASRVDQSAFAADQRFAGYDILLTEDAGIGSNTEFLGVDFNNAAESTIAGVTVSDIAAIPEPASIAIAGIGYGLLVQRLRRRQPSRLSHSH
jgi:hypothetical protein